MTTITKQQSAAVALAAVLAAPAAVQAFDNETIGIQSPATAINTPTTIVDTTVTGGPTIVDTNANANAKVGDVSAKVGDVSAKVGDTSAKVGDIKVGGGSSSSSSSSRIDNSGNSASTSSVDNSGNSTNNISVNPNQGQQQGQTATTSGTNVLNQNTKYEAAPNNVAPNVSGNGECPEGFSIGTSKVGSVGFGIGATRPNQKCIKTLEEGKNKRHADEMKRDVTIEAMRQGGPTVVFKVIREQAAESPTSAEAFNSTVAAVRNYRTHEDPKGNQKDPSMADLMNYSEYAPVREKQTTQAAADRANGKTGQNFSVSAPAPAFGNK